MIRSFVYGYGAVQVVVFAVVVPAVWATYTRPLATRDLQEARRLSPLRR